jgi:hypothetical protein
MDKSHLKYSPEEVLLLGNSAASCAFLFGKYESGKSSLAACLATNKPFINTLDDRTHVFNLLFIESEESQKIILFDIGWHPCYQDVWRILNRHCKHNFSILVHEITSKDYLNTFNWMRDSVEQAPLNNPLVALTKSDLCSKTQFKEHYDRFILEACKWCDKQCRLATLRIKQLEKNGQKCEHTNLILDRYNTIKEEMGLLKQGETSEMLYVTSSKDYTNVDEMREIMTQKSYSGDGLLSGSAVELYCKIGRLGHQYVTSDTGDKNNKQTQKQTMLQQKNNSLSSNQDLKLNKLPYVPLSNALEYLKQIKGCEVTHSELTEELCKLHERGLMIYFSDNENLKQYIFCDLNQFANVLKMFFNHDENKRFVYEDLDKELQIACTKSKYEQLRNMLKKGLMSFVILKNISMQICIELETLLSLLTHLIIAHPLN